MVKKSSNSNLHKANKAKNDEFYTQLVDVEKELKHYKDQLNKSGTYQGAAYFDYSGVKLSEVGGDSIEPFAVYFTCV